MRQKIWAWACLLLVMLMSSCTKSPDADSSQVESSAGDRSIDDASEESSMVFNEAASIDIEDMGIHFTRSAGWDERELDDTSLYLMSQSDGGMAQISMRWFYLTQTPEEYQVVFQQAALLSDKDIKIIKDVLREVYKNNTYALLAPLTKKIKEVTGIETSMIPLEFVETILKDHSHLANN